MIVKIEVKQTILVNIEDEQITNEEFIEGLEADFGITSAELDLELQNGFQYRIINSEIKIIED